MKHDLAYYRMIQGHDDAMSAKDAEIRMIKSELDRDFSASLDCENVQVNGTSQDLLITKTVDPTIKSITSRPSDVFNLGDIVGWLGTDWIVDAIDADNRITTRGKMRRCNVVLKWLDEDRKTLSYPAYCEDATKYSEGITAGKLLQVPDFQIKVKLHLDGNTVKLNRGKRFLLDAGQYASDMAAAGDHPSAYIITRRNVLTGNHSGHGYVELTLVETAFSERDNAELMIADYTQESGGGNEGWF